eukprot:100908-Pelagomonas_calceolata.AAC.6
MNFSLDNNQQLKRRAARKPGCTNPNTSFLDTCSPQPHLGMNITFSCPSQPRPKMSITPGSRGTRQSMPLLLTGISEDCGSD